MLGVASRFSTEKSFKIEKVRAFQKKNKSNELNWIYFFSLKSKIIFYNKLLIYK